MTNTGIQRTPFLWNWTRHPSFLPCGEGLVKTNRFFWERHERMFCVSNAEKKAGKCSNAAHGHSVRETQLKVLSLSLPECITWSIFLTIILELAAGAASKATPMGVPAPLGLFLYLKERWWVRGGGGGGGEGAKQTARVSTLRVNITLCLNCTPSARQFSHTLAPPPSRVSDSCSHPLKLAQLNTLLIPEPPH